MKLIARSLASMLLMMNAYAADFGTPEEAKALLKKAVAHIKTVGPEKAYMDFTAKKPEFVDRDLYVWVLDFQHNILAHGANERLPGKNMGAMKDPDGKEIVKEIAKAAQTQNEIEVDYKYTDPATKKILPKVTYCERVNETAVCVGAYKR